MICIPKKIVKPAFYCKPKEGTRFLGTIDVDGCNDIRRIVDIYIDYLNEHICYTSRYLNPHIVNLGLEQNNVVLKELFLLIEADSDAEKIMN